MRANGQAAPRTPGPAASASTALFGVLAMRSQRLPTVRLAGASGSDGYQTHGGVIGGSECDPTSATHSKCFVRKGVWVRLPPPAPSIIHF